MASWFRVGDRCTKVLSESSQLKSGVEIRPEPHGRCGAHADVPRRQGGLETHCAVCDHTAQDRYRYRYSCILLMAAAAGQALLSG